MEKDSKFRALKVLKLSRSDCRLELKISNTQNHKNLVKVYDVGTGQKHGYIVMEYCPLGDLANYLMGRELNEAQARCLVY